MLMSIVSFWETIGLVTRIIFWSWWDIICFLEHINVGW